MIVKSIIIDVAERHRGDDDLQQYLRKLVRTMNDMIEGRPVRNWRLDRLLVFTEDLANTTLAMCSRPPCGRW